MSVTRILLIFSTLLALALAGLGSASCGDNVPPQHDAGVDG